MPQQEKTQALVKMNKQQLRALKNLSKKKSVNLCMKEKATHPLPVLVGGIAIIIILVFCVAKFCVIDQLNRVLVVEAEYAKLESYNNKLLEKAKNYESIKEEYHRNSLHWVKDSKNELYVGVERTEVLDIIEDKLMSQGTVKSILINDNEVVVEMTGMNLKQISEMFIDLQEHELVADASLNIASTEAESTSSLLDFSVTINLSEEEVSKDDK